MDKDILSVIRYFDRFDYPVTNEEIQTFLSHKISLSLLNKRLDILLGQKKLAKGQITKKFNRFSFYHRRKLFALQKKKEKISQKKIKKINFYLKLLSFFPQIKLVGISGSLAMMNASRNDDIDLFIITARNRLFTGRFIAVVIGHLLGVRRGRSVISLLFSVFGTWLIGFRSIGLRLINRKPTNYNLKTGNREPITENRNKICLNLFFDSKKLSVPRNKMTLYVAHEILQMRPVINKSYTYEKFLKANLWVKKIFPNARYLIKFEILNPKLQINYKSKILNFKRFVFNISNLFGTCDLRFRIFDYVEKTLRKIQLYFINRHQTTEIVTSSQLWFHPVDFGQQIGNKE